MADTAVVTVELAKAGDYTIDEGVGTAIVAANVHVITPAGPLGEGFLVVQNTNAAAKDVTVLAGDSPPALSAGQGNKIVNVAIGSASYAAEIIGGLESARFLQDNGTLRVTVAAAMTGFMYWVQLPRI